ncbi:hypothetical protein PPYR_08969 [Photinus pyralis]|uniref:Inter-alpha-trypsin inhibitor heavy chain H4-like n=1 Tax=Photinus pyralis TaxID=7054 RepID=A0A5N4AKZ6_PHOPY|nr:hypothetical protein PPYR_08969 [Photinus pyralis]
MNSKSLKIPFIVGAILILSGPVLNAPMESDQSLVVSSTVPSLPNVSGKENKPIESVPQIYQMRVRSEIGNRFAHTTVTSRVRNYASEPREAVFSLILPESAFISGFIMEIDGKNYTALVKEKEEAQRDYEQAISSGLGAGHVAVTARDSNRFTVSVNIEREAKAAFYLTYEQLLKRQDGHYEQIINIHPAQPVKDLHVEVLIAESRKLVDLKAPPLRTGNKIGTDKVELDPRADITIVNDTSAIVTFTPNVERQKQFAHLLGTKEENGLSGQFVVQYDVERDPTGGEVLIRDGYFVHFFAPTELAPLPKQVVFVLDTSGSMSGQKIEQMKQAMHNILDQLNEQDTLSLVEFNSYTKVWDIDNAEKSVWYPYTDVPYYCSNEYQNLRVLKMAKFPRAYPANAKNIKNAKLAISAFKAGGSTGIFGALQVALRLVEIERVVPHVNDTTKRQPLVMFLTDGQPTDMSTNSIITGITEFNTYTKRSPIFALSFGDDVDKEFLQKLAGQNAGFSRHIYDEADASLQLEGFYRQISSPLLSDVTCKYEPSTTSLTNSNFPIHFGGSEIVIAGFCGTEAPPLPVVHGVGTQGSISLEPTVTSSVSNTERLWAYLSIKQLLEKEGASDGVYGANLKQQALDLALKYNFVTPVSSLVVVKPNGTEEVGANEGDRIDIDKLEPTTLPPPRTTPFCFIPTVPTDELDTILGSLPWLGILLEDNQFVVTPKGNFKLGLNETISDMTPCPKTPLGQEGYCALLHECPHAHSALETSLNFFDHFCILKNEFAGVCCPLS